jgi:hypothetical protein
MEERGFVMSRRERIVAYSVGAVLGGGGAAAAVLSGSDQALRWLARVMLGWVVFRFAAGGFIVWFKPGSNASRSGHDNLLAGASLAKAAGFAVVLLSGFSRLGFWVGLGIVLVAIAVDFVSDRVGHGT